MKMKKIICLIATLMALYSCSTQVTTAEKDGQAADTAAVVQRVNDIYARVLDVYGNSSTPSELISSTSLDSLYCSADWNEWVARVNDYDRQHGDDGMMGFFEADYWIMGQDWQDLAVSDVMVKELTDSTATVQLNLHNCGNVIPVRLEMALAGGVWKIDNFIDLANNLDWKAEMKEYLDKTNRK